MLLAQSKMCVCVCVFIFIHMHITHINTSCQWKLLHGEWLREGKDKGTGLY